MDCFYLWNSKFDIWKSRSTSVYFILLMMKKCLERLWNVLKYI